MKRVYLVCLGMLLSPSLWAADLLDIYRDARANDAAYASARAAYDAGREALPQGRALLLPSVNLNANTTYNDVDVQYGGGSFSSGRRTYNSHGVGLTLVQPVFRKENFALYEQSKLRVVQAEAQLSAAEQELILRVAQAYFDVLNAQDNIAFAEAQKKAISEQLAQAKRNFEVGTATVVDVHDAQSRFDLTTAQEIAARNELEIRRRALQKIIGRIPEELKRIGGKLPLSLPQPADMDAWVATSEDQNQQLRIQRAALEIANREVDRARSERLPKVDLVATYGNNRQGSSNFGTSVETESKTVGLQLNMPIYQGGAINSRVREALANQEKARQDLEETRRQAALQTRQAFLEVTSGEARVKALEQALISSQSALDSTKLGFEVGVRTSVDVLNSQQQYFSAQRDLAKARYDYLLSRLRLKAAVGTLSENDVAEMNTLLAGR